MKNKGIRLEGEIVVMKKTYGLMVFLLFFSFIFSSCNITGGSGVNYVPHGPYAYTTNIGDNTVSVIDTTTNTVVATVAVGSGPYAVAVNPTGTRVYVANTSDDTVSVIHAATNTVIATVPVGVAPSGVAVNSDGTRVYVANEGDSVSVIDTATNTVVATIGGFLGWFGAAGGIAVSPSGTMLYLNGQYESRVYAVDTSTNSVVARIPVEPDPIGVAVTPDGTRLYVTSPYIVGVSGYENIVSVIDTATNNVVTTIAVGSGPYGISIGPVIGLPRH